MQENNENQERNQDPDQKESYTDSYNYTSDSYQQNNQNVSGDSQYGQNASENYQYGQEASAGHQQYGENASFGNYQYGENVSGNYQYGQNTSRDYQQYNQSTTGNYQYGQHDRRDTSPGNGFGIASMVLGIISLALFCTCINIPLGIAAIVFGVLHLIRNPENKVFGIVGIVTSGISVVAFVLMIVLLWSPLQAYYQYREHDEIQRPFDYDDDDFDFDFDFPFSDDSGFEMPGRGGF